MKAKPVKVTKKEQPKTVKKPVNEVKKQPIIKKIPSKPKAKTLSTQELMNRMADSMTKSLEE